jgi:integrase
MPRTGVKRRGYGEGSVYPRKDGRWVSYIRLPDGRKKFFTGSEKVVRARLLEAQRQAHAGQLVIGRDQSLSMYLERWLSDAVRHSVRPGTYEDYDLCVRRLLPYLGRVRIRALAPEQIQHALGILLERGLAPRTVRQVHMVLRRALKQAVLWRIIPNNPSDAVKPPRADRKEMQTLNEDEIRRLLSVTKGTRQHALWALLATTGCRLGEALGLRWSDIDFKSSTATIRRSLQCQRGIGLTFVEPKSARSRRTVPLPAETLAVLSEHQESRDRDRREAAELWQETDLVFTTPIGGPRNPRNLSDPFHIALKRAGLPGVRIHDLRHSAATHLLVKHVHPKVVQDLLGHSTIAITLDTYSHVMPALAKEASSLMSSLVPEASPT